MALCSDGCAEVLRYMVQEKKVLHRDISFGNVLINPIQNKVETVQTTVESPGPVKVDTKGEIPHTYRFVHDLTGDGFVFSIDTNVDGALTRMLKCSLSSCSCGLRSCCRPRGGSLRRSEGCGGKLIVLQYVSIFQTPSRARRCSWLRM